MFSERRNIWIVLVTYCILAACGEVDSEQDEVARDWNEEILLGLFKKQVTEFDALLYPEVTSLQQLQEATERIYMPADTIFEAFSKVGNVELEKKQEHIVRLSYVVSDQSAYEGYAYVDRAQEKSDTAYLIIPGSGVNKASKIFYSEAQDYHCCLRKALDRNSDLYVYVKPNNDFLAIHNNGKVLNSKIALFPQLISMGGSYSTRYMVDAIALAKHLKTTYQKVVIAGLSQGGNAALFIALQVQPYAAIISSGFSVLNSGPVYVAGINQLVIPGFLSVYTPEFIANTMRRQSTRYLFTFGQAEKGIYGYETAEKVTEDFFNNIDNVRFHYHSAGHVFPVEAITAFLRDQGL